MKTTTGEPDLGDMSTGGLTGRRRNSPECAKDAGEGSKERWSGVWALGRSPVKGYKVTTEVSHQEPHRTSMRAASVEAMRTR